MQNLLLFSVSALVWGGTWLAINMQLGVVAVEVSVFYRHALAAVILFSWALLRGMKLRFPLRMHGWFLLLGFTLFGLNYVLGYKAQLYISSAMNAVLFATMVWINVLLSRLFFKTPFEWHVLLGAGLGMAGVVVLFWPSLTFAEFDDSRLLGIAISLSGATVASLGNMISHQAQSEKLPVLQSNAWGMFYGSVITGFWALFAGKDFNFEYSVDYVVSFLYLVIFGSIIAFGCYLRLLGRVGPSKSGYIAVIIPVIAVLLAVVFEDLQLDAFVITGVALVLGGNLMILLYRRLTTQRRPL